MTSLHRMIFLHRCFFGLHCRVHRFKVTCCMCISKETGAACNAHAASRAKMPAGISMATGVHALCVCKDHLVCGVSLPHKQVYTRADSASRPSVG